MNILAVSAESRMDILHSIEMFLRVALSNMMCVTRDKAGKWEN